jgi:hypothetical protein
MKTKIWIAILLTALVLAAGITALANGELELPRWAISSGATDASNGDITLNATLGQPVVGEVSDGEVTLGQGYWYGGSSYATYLPIILK